MYILEGVLKGLLVIVCALLGVAFLTVAERKFMSSIQRRRGPNVIGVYGLLQAFSDGLKLLLKETTKPNSAKSVLYMVAPGITFTLGLISWGVIPMGEGIVISDLNVGLLYILCISSLGVYGIIISGWSSNSKYAFLGGLRSTGQMISYEVSIGFTLVTVLLCSGSVNLTEIVWSQERIWYCIPLFPMFLVFIISMLAETNRHPFDLPEAEAELVSGYNVEYSAAGFALFFLGEYCNIIMMSSICVLLFMGGWLMPFNSNSLGIFDPLVMSIKVFLIVCIFIWARAAYPRYRYDQLMEIGWKSLLPISIGFVLYTSGLIYSFG